MLSGQYQFIVDKLDNNSWKEVTKEFNEIFQTTLSPGALKKRYDREIVQLEVLGDDQVEKAFKLIKANPMKPTDLAKRFNLDMDGLEDLLDDLMNSRAAIKFHQGYLILDKSAPKPDFLAHQLELYRGNDWVKWGIISDTHICSIHEELDLLHHFYRICEEEKVMGMINAGDITAGNGNVYRGQIQDLKIIGEDKQIQYVTSVYPQTSLRTYMIQGNHDADLYKQCGSDIIQKIADKREDITYLGKMSATLEQDGLRFMVRHGEGGLGGIRSARPQKMLDNLKAEEICNVTIIGHWHINLHIPSYRNSVVILPACFENQSEYLIRKGLVPDVGGCILEMKIADIDGKKVLRHRLEYLDYNAIMKN